VKIGCFSLLGPGLMIACLSGVALPAFAVTETPDRPALPSITPPAPGHADELNESMDELDDLFTDGLESLAEKRDRLSHRMFRMGLGLDRYLSGRDADFNELNESYARVRLGNTIRQDEAPVFDQDLKFRLDLPTAREKYRLVFENDVAESEIGRQGLPSDLGRGNLERDGLSAAISLAAQDLAQWDSNVNVGVRGTIPLDPFIRHSLTRRWDLGSDWTTRVRSRVSYFNSSGYNYDTYWRFDRMLDPDLGFRFQTRIDWSQMEDFMQMSQALGVTRFLDDSHLLDHAFGVFSSSLEHTRIDTYYFAVTHRSVLYQDWVILDLVPQIDWDREREFDSSLSFTARIEILFFQHNPFDQKTP
jgi:hypothetical protein